MAACRDAFLDLFLAALALTWSCYCPPARHKYLDGKGKFLSWSTAPVKLVEQVRPVPHLGISTVEVLVLLDLRPVTIMITMVRAAMLALGLACSAEAFTVPSALPAQRLTSRLPLLSAGRAAKVGIQTMMAKEVKERTVRAPVFEEVCEQTGITLSR
jgi:hypothetical protein